MGIVLGLLVVLLLLWIGRTLRDIYARLVLHGEALGEMGQLVKRLLSSRSL
jgi:hypothetical protein